jgi:serine/threonine protein kinase
MVTEYCEEGTLYNEITTKVNYDKEEKKKIILDLINAAEYLRTMHIVHRDIKL